MIPLDWLHQAAARLAPLIWKTPLTYDAALGVYFKWDNHQVTGSFKARGALNKAFSLEIWEREAGLVAASAGNHGQGVALAGQRLHAPVTVFVPENAVPAKIAAIQALGAQVQKVPGGYGEAEKTGLEYASSNHCTWISPYNDGQVIAGQGTLGLEILQEVPQLAQATWLVPVGGGGLISGIGAALSTSSPAACLVGVQSTASSFFHSIFHRGTQAGVTELPSLADGLAGTVEEGSVTIPMVKQFVSDLLLVSEEEIAQAIGYAWATYQERIEGSAAVGLAAILSGKMRRCPAVIIISGGNIQPETHQRLVQEKFNGHHPR